MGHIISGLQFDLSSGSSVFLHVEPDRVGMARMASLCLSGNWAGLETVEV